MDDKDKLTLPSTVCAMCTKTVQLYVSFCWLCCCFVSFFFDLLVRSFIVLYLLVGLLAALFICLMVVFFWFTFIFWVVWFVFFVGWSVCLFVGFFDFVFLIYLLVSLIACFC